LALLLLLLLVEAEEVVEELRGLEAA